MSQLVMDPLTNLPIKYEPVDLSGEEIGLQPIPTATASSGSSDRNVTSSTIPSQTPVQHSSSSLRLSLLIMSILLDRIKVLVFHLLELISDIILPDML